MYAIAPMPEIKSIFFNNFGKNRPFDTCLFSSICVPLRLRPPLLYNRCASYFVYIVSVQLRNIGRATWVT